MVNCALAVVSLPSVHGIFVFCSWFLCFLSVPFLFSVSVFWGVSLHGFFVFLSVVSLFSVCAWL